MFSSGVSVLVLILLFSVCGVWYVVCGMWYVVCGVWYVVCGVWYVVYAGACSAPMVPVDHDDAS